VLVEVMQQIALGFKFAERNSRKITIKCLRRRLTLSAPAQNLRFKSPGFANAATAGFGASRSLPVAPAKVSSLCFADLHYQNRSYNRKIKLAN
jgi:hypothetical protein